MERVAIDFETTGLNPRKDKLRLITTKCESRTEIWDCFKHSVDDTRNYLTRLSERPLIAHNLKFEAAWIFHLTGRHVHQDSWCTARAERVAQNGNGVKLGLWSTAGRHGCEIDTSNDQQMSDWSCPDLTADQLRYAAEDVQHLHFIAAKQPNLYPARLDMRCIPTEVEMEKNGIQLDTEKWMALSKKAEIAAQIEATLLDWDEEGINFNSPKQVLKWLKSCGLSVDKTSTTDLVYIDIPEVRTLLKLRKLRKLATSYGSDWLARFLEKDGAIHTSLSPRTETGRYSSSSPNLQQIPRDKQYRDCFKASPGMALVGADYSAIELRVAAFLANERVMLGAFERGEDVHKFTSTLLFNIPADSVTKQQRQTSKALSFGLLYGMGAQKLMLYAKQGYGVDMSLSEATELRNRFFRTYPALRRWQGAESRIGQLRQYAVTYFGRRRALDPLDYTSYLNTAVQGTAADIMKQALVALASHPTFVRPLLTVHDEIILECPSNKVCETKAFLKECMVDKVELSGLVDVEVKSGQTWGDCH